MKRLITAILLTIIAASAFANGRCLSRQGYDASKDPSCFASTVQQVPILMYHKVTAAVPPSDLVVSPRMFTAHIDAIKKAGYNTVTVKQLGEYMRGEHGLPTKSVVITFDDGWRDNLSAAMNLKDRGMVATFFVMSGVQGDSLYLSNEEIVAVSKTHEIGSHTHTHFMEWHNKLDTMDNRVMLGEIFMSKLMLEAVIGKPVTSFAWPFGYSRKPLNTFLRGAGYSAAVHVNGESANTVGEDPLMMRRLTVNGGCSPDQLIRLIENRKMGACGNEEVSRVDQAVLR